MIERYFSEKMKEIIDKLELGNITPKSLRRWFNTHLEKNSVNTSIIRRLMGHKGDIGDEHYNQIFEQAKEGEYGELALFFSENIDALVSLGNGNRKISKIDKKVEKLEQQNRDFIEQLANTNKKNSDLEKENKDLKNEITEIKATQEQIQLLLRSIARTKDKEIKISDKPITNKEYIEILDKENKK